MVRKIWMTKIFWEDGWGGGGFVGKTHFAVEIFLVSSRGGGGC